MMRGQSSAILGRNIYRESGEPYFCNVSAIQMEAYFGWRVATVRCFSNAELNCLRVLFQLPLPSLVRDYQHAQIRIILDGDGEKCMIRLEMTDHFWGSKVYQ